MSAFASADSPSIVSSELVRRNRAPEIGGGGSGATPLSTIEDRSSASWRWAAGGGGGGEATCEGTAEGPRSPNCAGSGAASGDGEACIGAGTRRPRRKVVVDSSRRAVGEPAVRRWFGSFRVRRPQQRPAVVAEEEPLSSSPESAPRRTQGMSNPQAESRKGISRHSDGPLFPPLKHRNPEALASRSRHSQVFHNPSGPQARQPCFFRFRGESDD